MKVWDTYAIIGSDNKVKNIALYQVGEGGYTLANLQAVETYGEDAYAVEVTQYPVQIGDDYIEGRFYRNGEEILPFPTDEQEIAMLKVENASLNSAVDDIIVAITPTEV